MTQVDRKSYFINEGDIDMSSSRVAVYIIEKTGISARAFGRVWTYEGYLPSELTTGGFSMAEAWGELEKHPNPEKFILGVRPDYTLLTEQGRLRVVPGFYGIWQARARIRMQTPKSLGVAPGEMWGGIE